MTKLTKSHNTVRMPKVTVLYYVKRALSIQLCFLESVTTNAIFFRAIVQNDEPHIHTSGHLKRNSKKI